MNSAELRGQVWLGSQVWRAVVKDRLGGPIFQVHHEGAVRVGHDSLNFVARGYVELPFAGTNGKPTFGFHFATRPCTKAERSCSSSLPQAAVVPTCSTASPRCREGEYRRDPAQIAVLALGVVQSTVGCFQACPQRPVNVVDGGNSRHRRASDGVSGPVAGLKLHNVSGGAWCGRQATSARRVLLREFFGVSSETILLWVAPPFLKMPISLRNDT